MPTYVVEEMKNDRVIRSRAIGASTPFLAASEMINRRVGSRKWEKDWVRVTDEVRGRVFAYALPNDFAPRIKTLPKGVGPTPA